MKPTVIGAITTLILLMGIPLLVDGLLYLLFSPFKDFSMTGFLLKGYFGILPLFICYLAIAAVVIYLWNKKMKKS